MSRPRARSATRIGESRSFISCRTSCPRCWCRRRSRSPPPSSPKRRCLFWALANSLPRLRGAACSIPPSVSSSMRPGWRFGRGLRFFSLFLPSTWSATACATRSIRARVDRAALRSGAFYAASVTGRKAQKGQLFSGLPRRRANSRHLGMFASCHYRTLLPLDPNIILGRALAARMAGIEYPTRLDQQQLDLVFGVRLVLYTLRDDEHLARRQLDRPIAKIDAQSALQDDERLIRMLVIMPNEVTLQPHELELVVVHFGYDLRLPLLVE